MYPIPLQDYTTHDFDYIYSVFENAMLANVLKSPVKPHFSKVVLRHGHRNYLNPGKVASYLLLLPGAVLDPLQVDVTEAGPGDPLQAVDVVLINLHTEHSRVPLNVVPFGVGLQSLHHGGILQPRLQFG